MSLPHLPALDGLRAVAVFTVMTYHFGFDRVPGDLGVSAFFVLSGFLITWLLLKESSQNGRISLRSFYLRRTLRIFPAYYAFLIFSFLQESVRGYYWDTSLLLSGLFYFMNYFNALNEHPNTAIAHAWSLSIEEQFYLLWPPLFLFLNRMGKKTITLTLISIIGFVVVWRSVLFLGLGASNSYIYNAFETRFDNIAVGCLLAMCVESRRFQDFAQVLAKWTVVPFLTLTLLLWSRMGGTEAYHYSLGFTVDALLLAVLILQMVQLYRSWMWSWLEQPFTRYLGRISYPLYLYHLFGFGVVNRLGILPTYSRFALGILVCITIASASYWIIERPFLKLKHSWGSKAQGLP